MTGVSGSTSSPCPSCRSFMNPGGYCPDPWHRPVTAQPSPDLPTRPSHGCQDCNTTCDQRCACPGCTAPTSPDLPDSLPRLRPLDDGFTTSRSGVQVAPVCRAQYPQSPNPLPHTRIIRCHLPVGHPGEHEEADTEVTWLDLPATKPAGEDVYRETARAALAVNHAEVSVYATMVLGEDPAHRAAVDEAVRLTEQRPDQSDDHLVAQLTVQLMNARTDLAAMTARTESAEHRYDVMRREAEHLGHNLLAAVYAWLEGASDRMDLDDGRRIIDALCDDFLARSIEGWLPPLGTTPPGGASAPEPSSSRKTVT